jgi:hypothetical protein
VLVCNGGLSVAFAVYGFANPDLANQVTMRIANGAAADATAFHCSYIEGTDSCVDCPSPYDDCVGTDVTNKWTTLFIFGFIGMILPIVLACMGVCQVASGGNKVIGGIYSLTMCVSCCGNFAWLITACVFRFSAWGGALALDNTVALATGGSMSTMPSTGLFILVWVIIQFCVMGCVCCWLLIMFIACKDHFAKFSGMM